MTTLSIDPVISPSATVRDCSIGIYTEIADQASLVDTALNDYSYVMERTDIIYTDIGKFSNIASDVRINPGNHPIEWVSQHHFLYRKKQYGFDDEDNEAFFNLRKIQRVKIGHDTWIGHKAIIMPGVTIGNGAVVGAGAIVTKDVAPYSIVAGSPAKLIRSRFPKAIYLQLEKISWWDWDHKTIKERMLHFYNLSEFIKRYGTTR